MAGTQERFRTRVLGSRDECYEVLALRTGGFDNCLYWRRRVESKRVRARRPEIVKAGLVWGQWKEEREGTGRERSPSSMQVIPRDQTSTLPSYCPSSIARITSGAILGEQSG